MAQIKNTFVKSKMNRDLDSRLIPNGEYREGRNIGVSKSEGSDVGALENIKGNASVLPDFINQLNQGITENEKPLEIIGMFTHEDTSSIYLFLTTFSDSSKDQLSNKAFIFQSHCYIARIKYNGNLEIPEERRYESSILVEGSFLNFSKTHPILGFNIVEDLMFWTDNRNQPRKINIEKASKRAPNDNSKRFYYNEDQISVAKYYPYNPISLIKRDGANYSSTVKATTTEWLPISLSAPLDSIKTVGSDDVLSFLDTAQPQPAPPVDKPNWTGTGAANSSIANFFSKNEVDTSPVVRIKNASRPGAIDLFIAKVLGNEVSVAASSSSVDTIINVPTGWANPGDVIVFQLKNPEYDSGFTGDREFLKDKFPRFSYRFKYTDNEFSLMAPFTQPVFIPAQYNSFTYGDEDNSTRTTELGFMENRASEIGLVINLPYYPGLVQAEPNSNPYPALDEQLQRELHINEIEILFKSSNDNNVYVMDSIDISKGCPLEYLVAPNSSSLAIRNQFIYTYKGKKPYKVLPESDVTRVNDITPTRAQAQETSGNRIMYGNYVDNHALPNGLWYEASSSVKKGSFSPQFNTSTNPPIASTINNKIKEYYNSTLKQGRNYQIGVVLSDRYGRQSTVMLADESSDYGTGDKDRSTIFSPYDNSGETDVLNFFGSSLKMDFYRPIPDKKDYNVKNYPGLYQANLQPTGWYSYKIVVKQQQQEYYNVYLPGSMSGNVVYTNNETKLDYSDPWNISNLSLYGDNINKIPRDMTNVGPTDRIYGSKESLYFRVVQPNYSFSATPPLTVDVNRWNSRQSKLPVLESTVVSIQPFLDMGKWTTQKGVSDSISYPGGYIDNSNNKVPGTIDPFIKSDNNPFIANVDNNENKDRVGFFNTTQQSKDVGGTVTLASFSNSLIVAETKPVDSNLELYWETATSGLISELNSGIVLEGVGSAPKDLTTFVFTGDESILYDGTTIDKALLNKNIRIVNNSGSVNTNQNSTITLAQAVSIDSAGNELVITSYFECYEAVSSPRSYNIKINQDSSLGDNSSLYFNSDNLLNWGNKEIQFTFNLSTPNELPATVVKKNNFFSNAAPTMGSTPNPSANAPYAAGWNGDGWAFSIGGEEPDYGQTDVDYIKDYPMFEKSGISTTYEVTSTSINNVISRNERFFTQYNVPGSTTAEDPKFDPGVNGWNNGSYVGAYEGCELYIEKLECAVYDKNHNELYPFLEWIIADGAQMPLKVDFGGLYGDQGLRYTWREYPWKVEYVDANDPIWSGLSSLNFTSGYYLFANEQYPPFEWHGAAREKNNGRFWAEGFLNGGDYSVHKITIGVKETFDNGLTSQAGQFVVYTKLYR